MLTWVGWDPIGGMNEFKRRTHALVMCLWGWRSKVANWPIFSQLWKSFWAKNKLIFMHFSELFSLETQLLALSRLNNCHWHNYTFSILSLCSGLMRFETLLYIEIKNRKSTKAVTEDFIQLWYFRGLTEKGKCHRSLLRSAQPGVLCKQIHTKLAHTTFDS